MSSLGSILNIARNAIATNQTAVRVASNNLANAGTEGYSRQVTRTVETRPDQTPLGRLGTGVRVYDVARVRDTLLDTS
jgi:flagellar hook-associated protein 1 FlgK